jgi:hypothetical protein
MNVLAALSAGRDVAALVSASLQLLGNPSTAAEPKRLAYDLASAAQLADTGGWCRPPPGGADAGSSG